MLKSQSLVFLCLYHDDHNQLELPSVKLTFQLTNTFGNLPLVPVQLSIRDSNIINWNVYAMLMTCAVPIKLLEVQSQSHESTSIIVGDTIFIVGESMFHNPSPKVRCWYYIQYQHLKKSDKMWNLISYPDVAVWYSSENTTSIIIQRIQESFYWINGPKYSRMEQLKFFKGCLPQIWLGPFLNTLTQIYLNSLSTYMA